MRAQIAKYWDAIRSSYWFLPTVMALAAILLSLLTTALDAVLGDGWTADLDWLSFNTPAGARALLSTIAGSMITVAGVTFSITIAAVAYATSQLGPRLLGNFMRDRGNQITLGTFIATFVYCLLVLRTVHGQDGASGAERFVPHLGVLVGLGLTLASLGVLIYFIHHIPMSIQASEVVAQVGVELNDKLATLFPGYIGEAAPEAADPAAAADAYPPGTGEAVRSSASGYITHLDAEGLLDLAREHELVLRLVRQPGDFVSEGEPLAFAHGARATEEDLRRTIGNAFALDRERTQAQDVLFLVQQLVEIAARALSPGVNDPFTAIGCLDWLGDMLVNLGNRSMPSGCRYDEDGRLRVITPSLTFADVASAVFDQLRPYASADRNAALHMMAVIGRVLASVEHEPYRTALREHAAALMAGAERGLGQERDLEQLREAYARLPHRREAATKSAAGAQGE